MRYERRRHAHTRIDVTRLEHALRKAHGGGLVGNHRERVRESDDVDKRVLGKDRAHKGVVVDVAVHQVHESAQTDLVDASLGDGEQRATDVDDVDRLEALLQHVWRKELRRMASA